MIYNKTIKEFTELIGSSKTPVPAGGSTIALNGLLGLNLLKLCCLVSMKKNNEKESFSEIISHLEKSENVFLEVMDDDISTFNKNLENHFSSEDELKELIKVPFTAAREAGSILKLTKGIKDRISKNVMADFEVAIYNLNCCLNGAVSIIESNYQFFQTGDEFIVSIKEEIDNNFC